MSAASRAKVAQGVQKNIIGKQRAREEAYMTALVPTQAGRVHNAAFEKQRSATKDKMLVGGQVVHIRL